jgi:exopolysaccharide biosynthesis protein
MHKIKGDIMNIKIKKIISKLCIVTMSCSVMMFSGITTKVASAATTSPSNGVGEISSSESYEIARGAVLNRFESYSATTKDQKVNVITFNPKTSDIGVLATFGNVVYSRQTVSSMAKAAEGEGYDVVGGINSDFFYSNGVPVGLFVQDGRLISYGQHLSSDEKVWKAVGFKKDGSVIIGQPHVINSYTVNGGSQEYPFFEFNKTRNELGIFLYSSDYAASTKSDLNSLDVILNIDEGDIKLGQPIKCTVENILEEVKDTPIEKNKLVLSVQVYTQYYDQLKKLKVGDKVNISMREETGEWNDVEQAVGAYKILLNNGQVVSNLDTSDRYPTTALGLKENGDVVVVQIDGRQPGWSNGIPYNDTAKYLKSLGCTNAVVFDGGGSSALVTKLPWEASSSLINKPSDGSERKVSNGLVFFNKSDKTDVAGLLHSSQSSVNLSAGETFKVDVIAADTNYHYMNNQPKLTYTLDSDIGKISEDGVFTANRKGGSGTITVTSGIAKTNIAVNVKGDTPIVDPKTTNPKTYEELTKQVDYAVKSKSFYYYNMALYETTKLTNADQKAVLLSKLATIEKTVWTDDVKSIYKDLQDMANTSSARIYDNVQVKINNANLMQVDKDYLMTEVTSWGKNLVWTEDYKTALNSYMEFFNKKDAESAKKAQENINNIKNSYSKEYLTEELNNLKTLFGIK